MQRFYNSNVIGENFSSKDKLFLNQILKVLRLASGDSVIFFNGKDNIDYVYEISSIDKKVIFFTKKDIIKKEEKKDININIFQALANKISKIELILQKGVEVGIDNFYFFLGERSQKFFISDQKKQRLEKIIIEAVEQSGRNKIPSLNFLDKIFFGDLKNDLNLFFHTKDNNSKSLLELNLEKTKNINCFIGPEGGFSQKEINNFLENNFLQIYLGNNILRTETVPIVVGFCLNEKLRN